MARPRPLQRKRPLSGWIVVAMILVLGVGWVFGSTWMLTLTNADDVHPGPSLTLEGHWDGQTLTVRPTSDPFLTDGTYQAVRTISTNDTDDSFTPSDLHASDSAAFEAGCRQLRA